MLAVACTQWFCIMHECGHKTFSGGRSFDTVVGHLAGVFCLMPFETWRFVHHGHHLWTGWRDRDPTTRGILPRPIGRTERMFFNTCWRLWIPVFAFAYRATIFWNLRKLIRYYPRQKRAFTINVVALFIIYTIAAPWMIKIFSLPLLLHFAVMDPIMLSQHSHIPQKLAGSAAVKPIVKAEQGVYTRSVLLPRLLSTWVFLGFDLHGLHHVYPYTPGYRLHRLDQVAGITMSWRRWIKEAKRVPADILIFKNWDQTRIRI